MGDPKDPYCRENLSWNRVRPVANRKSALRSEPSGCTWLD